MKNEQAGVAALRWRCGVIAILCFAAMGEAQTIPATTTKALDGGVVTLPQPEAKRPLLLLISFSRRGEKQFGRWNLRLKSEYLKDAGIDYYQLVDFQGVPPFVMSFILHGMRRKVPKDEWSHFAFLRADEKGWMELAHYANPENAYVIATDANGKMQWQTHGEPTDRSVDELRSVLASQRASQKTDP